MWTMGREGEATTIGAGEGAATAHRHGLPETQPHGHDLPRTGQGVANRGKGRVSGCEENRGAGIVAEAKLTTQATQTSAEISDHPLSWFQNFMGFPSRVVCARGAPRAHQG